MLDDLVQKLADAIKLEKVKPLPRRSINYGLDICLCLDINARTPWLVKYMKRQLHTLGFDVVSRMSELGKQVERLRVRIIAFGGEEQAIEATPFIELPTGIGTLYERATTLDLDNRDVSGPSRGLDALRYAIDSDWTTSQPRRRHVIAILTDDATLPGGISDELYESWEKLDAHSKRIVIFAPRG